MRITLFLCCLMGVTAARAQQHHKTSVEKAVSRYDEAVNAGRLENVQAYYDPEAVVMPEYHTILYGRDKVAAYWEAWFRATSANRVTRQVVDLQLSGPYALESGNAERIYLLTGKDTVRYRTKYLRVWNASQPGSPRILAEIWGSVAYLDRSAIPAIPDLSAAPPASHVPPATEAAITKRNALIRSLVMQRNGEAHAQLFSKDAIYMPYYEQMYVGFDSVKSYFVRHERPGDVTIDSLDLLYANMVDIGGMILENGFYTVRWRAGDNSSGIVKGKSINIWRKDEQGEWMLYRQMVNHD